MNKWTKEEILFNLKEGNRVWVERAVIAIFNKQTFSEKNLETTINKNGIGYNVADANIMSSFAKHLKKNKHLSEEQFAIAQKKIVKYSGQLEKIANKLI